MKESSLACHKNLAVALMGGVLGASFRGRSVDNSPQNGIPGAAVEDSRDTRYEVEIVNLAYLPSGPGRYPATCLGGLGHVSKCLGALIFSL